MFQGFRNSVLLIMWWKMHILNFLLQENVQSAQSMSTINRVPAASLHQLRAKFKGPAHDRQTNEQN